MHPYCELAKSAVEQYVAQGTVPLPPATLTSDFERRAATFVSIHLPAGELRGCIGTVQPTEANLAREIIRNAIAAASRDPRFSPVTVDELAGLVYSVDVLGEPEPVASIAELDPQQFGVLVSSGNRRGLLLPDLEGVDSAELQLAIALDKGNISPAGPFQIRRFRVERYH